MQDGREKRYKAHYLMMDSHRKSIGDVWVAAHLHDWDAQVFIRCLRDVLSAGSLNVQVYLYLKPLKLNSFQS